MTQEPKFVEFEIDIDDELYAQIVILAAEEGITVDEWVSNAVHTYLDNLIEEEEDPEHSESKEED